VLPVGCVMALELLQSGLGEGPISFDKRRELATQTLNPMQTLIAEGAAYGHISMNTRRQICCRREL